MNIVDVGYFFLKILGGITKKIFMNNYTAGKNFKLNLGGGIIGAKEDIIIGNNVTLDGWLVSDGGKIIIDDNTKINRGTVIRSMELIEIGSYCDIANDVYIQDHNSRSLDYMIRRREDDLNYERGIGKKEDVLCVPVRIGNDVWIGRRAMILKGVNLPDKSIVGAGAVMTKGSDKPALFVGNPARIARYID